jgi:pimeloyl-ACP methyl ester carboxylesterase
MTAQVRHRRTTVNGVDVFFREAGPPDAPVVVLPHGYPCSSYEFRRYMEQLGDRWRLLAPDFPGSGYSGTPEDFAYDFDGFADWLRAFLDQQGVGRFALYLHDFGGWIGLRLAMRDPAQVAALIIQNGDIYEDAMGPKYAGLREAWAKGPVAGLAQIREAVSLEGFEEEFLNEVRPELAERIPPDLWRLHWALTTERRREIYARIIFDLKANLDWFPRYQAYLREHRPPILILWGPQDGYMPEASARAYLRDRPDAELHLLDGGHWLLETCLPDAVALSRAFLERTHPPSRPASDSHR